MVSGVVENKYLTVEKWNQLDDDEKSSLTFVSVGMHKFFLDDNRFVGFSEREKSSTYVSSVAFSGPLSELRAQPKTTWFKWLFGA